MKLGIVGLGGSGKTTIFNALTQRSSESVTSGGKLTPVLDVVKVPDARVEWLTKVYEPKKTTYAQITYMDLQGMVGSPDNKSEYMASLLVHMRTIDAFLLVVRNFESESFGKAKPQAELSEFQDELILADLSIVEKRLERLDQDSKRGKPIPVKEKELLDQCLTMLHAEKPLRINPELANAPELKGFTLLTAKPMLVLVNNSDDDSSIPALSVSEKEVLMVRGRIEKEVAELSPEEAAEFLKDYGIDSSVRERLIKQCYEVLQLSTFLTVGKDEVRAWTISLGANAVEAAGAIHTDIQKGFIRAEVVGYEDMVRCNGDMNVVKKEGVFRLEGKTYIVKDGDVVHFRFNV